MAKFTIMGRDFEVAPYRIGAMRQAAPIIERINAIAGSTTTLEGAVEAAADMCAFLSIGLVKLDPALTPAKLEDEIGLAEAPALQKAMLAVLADSGLKQGEVQAPPAPAPEGASDSSSSESSSS